MQDGKENVDLGFIERLKTVCPELSNTEREICSYIKLKLSTKEIASLRKSSDNAIRVTRHRIKAKLGLKDLTQLDSYIETL